MVKQWQDLFYQERYSATTMFNPNFVQLAESMHVCGLRCEREEELEQTLAEMLSTPGPVLAEILVEKNEHCMPMVAAGKALHEMVLGDFEDCPPTTSA